MTRLAPCFLLAALLAPLAHAQAVITLADALTMAQASSPRLEAARARVDASAQGVNTAGQYPNPDVQTTLGSVQARIPGVATGSSASIGIAQPLELPSVRSSRMLGAQAQQQSSEAALTETRLDLIAAVKLAYFDVLQRKAEVALALDTESVLAQIRNRIEARVNVGESPKLELARADAELARARTTTAAARLRVAQALAQLRTAIGARLPESFDVAELKPQDAPLPTLESLRDEAQSRHPALVQARAGIARAQARLDNERALRAPQPTLIAGVDRQPETHQWLLGVALPLPLFNQRQGQIGEARAALDEAIAGREARRIELLGALESAVRRAEIARQQVNAFEGGLIKQAESALAVADAAYRFGERGFIEVLDAQRLLRQVRSDLLAARFELQAALIEIERLRAADVQ